jgi:hypothetical protein
MKSRVLLWSAISVLILGVAASAYWWLSRPQVLVLDDGTRLTLLAVTYGKRHTLPASKTGGRKIHIERLTTTNDSLCLWLDQKLGENNGPNYQLLAFDAANTSCSQAEMRRRGSFNDNNRTDQVVALVFESFPRRGRKIYFRAQQWGNGQQELSPAGFIIRNPAPRDGYPKWTPDILPVTREDDDLQVTLTRFEIDGNGFNGSGLTKESKDPMRNWVLTAFRVEQNGSVVTNWRPFDIETLDATGNHSKTRSWNNRQEDDEEVMTYQWGLWPGEPAWKLNVEMSRLSGFTADEMWTASGVLLKTGDIGDLFQRNKRGEPCAETTIGQFHVKVFRVIQLSPDRARNYGGDMDGLVLVKVEPPPEGFRLNLTKVTDDQNRPVGFHSWTWGAGDFRFALKNLADVKSLNITMALHRSRYAQFTVKPPGK